MHHAARAVILLLVSTIGPTGYAAGLDEQALAPGWECRVVTERDDIWLKTYHQGQPQYEYRIGAGGSLADVRQVSGKKITPLFATSPLGRLADQQMQWTLQAESLSRKLPGVPASGWTYQVGQGIAWDNALAPTVAAMVLESGCQIDVFATPQEQFRREQRVIWQGVFPALTRYRIVGPGALSIRQVVRISGAKADGKQISLDTIRFQTSLPLLKSPFTAVGLGLGAQHIPDRSYRFGPGFPAFADWPIDKANPLLVAFDHRAPQERTSVTLGISPQKPCRFGPQGCTETFGDSRVNLFEASGTLTVLPSLQFPKLGVGDIIDQSLLLLPATGLTAAHHDSITWLQAQIPQPRVVPVDQVKAAGLSVIAAKLAFFEDAGGLRSNRLARAIALNSVPLDLLQPATQPASVDEPAYRLSVMSSAQLLDIADASKDDGAPALQAPYRPVTAINQRWQLQRDANGNFSLINRWSGMCLEPENSSKNAQAQVQQKPCHNGISQKWNLRPTATGHWEIANALSHLCLDADNGNRKPGAPMQQWPCNGRDQQRWKIEEVDPQGKSSGKRFQPVTDSGFVGARLTMGKQGDAWWSSSAALPPGYVLQASWGLAVPRSEGARPVYECRSGDNTFLSLQSDCEGQRSNGVTSWIYNAPIPGSLPLYRCIERESKAYYLSNDKQCEGEQTDRILGFVLR